MLQLHSGFLHSCIITIASSDDFVFISELFLFVALTRCTVHNVTCFDTVVVLGTYVSLASAG